MRTKKVVDVIYVDPISKERSGIGRDVPAHVKLEWRDDQGRRVSHILGLTPAAVKEIAALPDVDTPMELRCVFTESPRGNEPCGPVVQVVEVGRIDGLRERRGYCQRCYEEIFTVRNER